jgi:AmmeMemoRadiSam system protein A
LSKKKKNLNSFLDSNPMTLTKEQGKILLEVSRKTMEAVIGRKPVDIPSGLRKQKALSEQPGVFVTLLRGGKLSGSMGYPPGTMPVVDAVIRTTRDSAFKDPRFKNVKAEDLPQVKIRIDILTDFVELEVDETGNYLKKIKAGVDGVMIRKGPFRGIELPSDAKKFKWSAQDAVEKALIKAQLTPEMWNDKHLSVSKFSVQTFEESTS